MTSETVSTPMTLSTRQYHATCGLTISRGAEIPHRLRSERRRDGGMRASPRRRSGQYRQLREADGLLDAEHDVHVLNRLTGGTLHEVVDDREHDERVAVPRPVNGDAAGVGRAHRARVRMAARRHDVDERLACEALLVERLEIGFARDARVERRVDPANHR